LINLYQVPTLWLHVRSFLSPTAFYKTLLYVQ
jgi:hypothetical protein